MFYIDIKTEIATIKKLALSEFFYSCNFKNLRLVH